jgi:hypothetical protein
MCVDDAEDSLAESGFVGCLAAVVCISILAAVFAIFARNRSRHALLQRASPKQKEKGG